MACKLHWDRMVVHTGSEDPTPLQITRCSGSKYIEIGISSKYLDLMEVIFPFFVLVFLSITLPRSISIYISNYLSFSLFLSLSLFLFLSLSLSIYISPSISLSPLSLSLYLSLSHCLYFSSFLSFIPKWF